MARGVLNATGYLSRRHVASVARENFLFIFRIRFSLRRYNVSKIFNGMQYYATVALLDRLNESLTVLTRDNSSLDSNNNKMYTYALMDWRDAGWNPILAVVEQHQQLLVQELMPSRVARLTVEAPDLPSCDVDADCPSEFGDYYDKRVSIKTHYFSFK